MEAPATPETAETTPAQERSGEPTLEAAAPPAGAVVQHVGSWLLLCLLRQVGLYDLAARNRGEVAMSSLRPAIDTAAIALALGEGCIEGVRRLGTPSVATLLRHEGGVSASCVRRVLHDFAAGAGAHLMLRPRAAGRI